MYKCWTPRGDIRSIHIVRSLPLSSSRGFVVRSRSLSCLRFAPFRRLKIVFHTRPSSRRWRADRAGFYDPLCSICPQQSIRLPKIGKLARVVCIKWDICVGNYYTGYFVFEFLLKKLRRGAKLEREFRVKFQGDNADDERYDSWWNTIRENVVRTYVSRDFLPGGAELH